MALPTVHMASWRDSLIAIADGRSVHELKDRIERKGLHAQYCSAVDPRAPMSWSRIAERLATPSSVLEDPNPDMFLRAVANVAKARGMATVAEASGLGRESLYKALAPGAKVRYETVRKLVDSLGVKLTVTT